MIWLELCTTYSSSSPVVTTTSIILCFNKHWLTQVHLENGRKMERENYCGTGLLGCPAKWSMNEHIGNTNQWGCKGSTGYAWLFVDNCLLHVSLNALQHTALSSHRNMQIKIYFIKLTSCMGRHNMPRPSKLTFVHLILKEVSESRVTWATPVPILVFLGLSVLDLGLM